MKIEVKGSLWMVKIESGEYSDYECDYIVVSGNNYEEAKNAVKIFYQETIYHNTKGLIFSDGELWQYRGEPCNVTDGVFDTCYGFGERVEIERLSVVYTGGEIARETLHKD